jgi:hypothetical protein
MKDRLENDRAAPSLNHILNNGRVVIERGGTTIIAILFGRDGFAKFAGDREVISRRHC